MKQFLLATLSLVFLLGFTACNSAPTPSSAALKIVNALKDENYAYVLDNTVKKDGTHFTEQEKMQLTAIISEKTMTQKKVKEAKVISEELNEAGDEAQVKMDVLYDNESNESVTYNMKKVNGKWQNVEDK